MPNRAALRNASASMARTCRPPPRLAEAEINQTVAATRVAFTFIVHNGESYLERNLRVLTNLGAMFHHYRVFFVENDSNDRTRSIIIAFQRRFPGTFVGRFLDNVSSVGSSTLCPSTLRSRNCPARLLLLAKLRQVGLQMAQAAGKWDAIVAVDLDFKMFPLLSYLETFALGMWLNATAIFGSSRYVDSRGSLAQYDADVIRPRSMRLLIRSGCLATVSSAFGAIGTYYHPHLILASNASYTWSAQMQAPYNGRTYEHTNFNQALATYAAQTRLPGLFVDPRLKPIYEWGDASFEVRHTHHVKARRRAAVNSSQAASRSRTTSTNYL